MPYSTINNLLLQNTPYLTAAEAHGVAAGMLCVNGKTTDSYWLEELLDATRSISADDQQLLSRLFAETRRLLASSEFEFTLLLPDDDMPLTERVTALKNWCQGFLFGTGCGQLTDNLSTEAKDILKDITEFTKLDAEAEGEEDEAAFMEVSEYLRTAVMLLRDELDTGSAKTIH